MINDTKLVFFGTPDLAVYALAKMQELGTVPDVIVTAPPAPAGRGRKLTEPDVKLWADANNIPTLQPTKIDADFVNQLKEVATPNSIFAVFAFGKILPKQVLDIPTYGTLNIHPSLLPKLRGPSPIRTAILKDMHDELGVSIILLDEKMDHGPILMQEKVVINNWPIPGRELDKLLSEKGGEMLAKTINEQIAGTITPTPQEHSQATFSKFFNKADAKINLSDDPYTNYLKICAYDGWPGAFFFKDGKRIKITKAHLSKGELVIDKVIPEGKKEMDYTQSE